MSVNTVEILEQLKFLTLLEASELVKQIEESFGVDASNTQRFYQPNSINTTCIDYDFQWENDPVYTVVLEKVPADKKIAILKVVRTVTGLGLKEAKDFVESAPKAVEEKFALSAAKDIKQQLESVGATVSLK
ncbi:MAG TPA: 50S ribosomal protein L7/L12 [Waterburya sp.]|jgi:large subunit ribosomal protein L7/L12